MYKLNKDTYKAMYRALYLIRRTEEHMMEINKHTPIPELPHASIGQEAISVGTCFAMIEQDQIIPSLRTRGAFLLKGVSSRTMMAGSFGKDVEPARGKNTAHHLGDVRYGVLAGTGLIGSHLPAACGAALAQKKLKTGGVTVVYYGDGGSNRGDVHEAMNMASIWSLPVIFVVENNEYALSTPRSYSMKIKDIADRAAGYGMPGEVVDGNDPIAVYKASAHAYERARKGEGPTLLECKTYRWRGHSEKDQVDKRPPEEVAYWKAKCPVANFKKFLLEKKYATQQEIDKLEADAEAEVVDAVEFAEKAPFPPADILETNVYES